MIGLEFEEYSKQFKNVESLLEYIDEIDKTDEYSLQDRDAVIKVKSWKDFKSLHKHDQCSGLKYVFPTTEMEEMYDDYVELEKEKNIAQEERDILREKLNAARKIYKKELTKYIIKDYEKEEQNAEPKRPISSWNLFLRETCPRWRKVLGGAGEGPGDSNIHEEKMGLFELLTMYNALTYDEKMIYEIKAKVINKKEKKGKKEKEKEKKKKKKKITL